jgi:hypothetical protein
MILSCNLLCAFVCAAVFVHACCGFLDHANLDSLYRIYEGGVR